MQLTLQLSIVTVSLISLHFQSYWNRLPTSFSLILSKLASAWSCSWNVCSNVAEDVSIAKIVRPCFIILLCIIWYFWPLPHRNILWPLFPWHHVFCVFLALTQLPSTNLFIPPIGWLPYAVLWSILVPCFFSLHTGPLIFFFFSVISVLITQLSIFITNLFPISPTYLSLGFSICVSCNHNKFYTFENKLNINSSQVLWHLWWFHQHSC